jgi:hypothetical protein
VAWPQALQINAYAGHGSGGASGAIGPEAEQWPLRTPPPRALPHLKPAKPADLRDWQNEDVGWGVVAVEPANVSTEVLKSGSDLPEPIQQLRKDRGNAPLFRFRPASSKRYGMLRNYVSGADLAIGQSAIGIGREAIPRYLLIYGGPDEVPWELQYVLNASYAVGRLSLTGEALENYVVALRAGWKESAANTRAAVIWAVNLGAGDISALMRDLVAQKLYDTYSSDQDLKTGVQFLDGEGQASAGKLVAALASAHPGLVVSTSHGQTYPLDNLETMGASLGLLVDQDYRSLRIDDLLCKWTPDGAIWYAHACCSAGSAALTQFNGLTQPGSQVDRVLTGVSRLGNRIAPLPAALLGCKKPLRAFIGHVEPTFDWTLQNPDNRQALTDSIQKALYTELYQPSPVGHALRRWYDRLASLFASYQADQDTFSRGGNTRESMLKEALVARDVRSMIILGDPTVALPSL